MHHYATGYEREEHEEGCRLSGPQTALPDATMPEAPPMDTLAASMPPMPGVGGDSMPGNMMAPG